MTAALISSPSGFLRVTSAKSNRKTTGVQVATVKLQSARPFEQSRLVSARPQVLSLTFVVYGTLRCLLAALPVASKIAPSASILVTTVARFAVSSIPRWCVPLSGIRRYFSIPWTVEVCETVGACSSKNSEVPTKGMVFRVADLASQIDTFIPDEFCLYTLLNTVLMLQKRDQNTGTSIWLFLHCFGTSVPMSQLPQVRNRYDAGFWTSIPSFAIHPSNCLTAFTNEIAFAPGLILRGEAGIQLFHHHRDAGPRAKTTPSGAEVPPG
jgi:hypothetical protein